MPGSSTINVKCSLFAITSVKTELLLYPLLRIVAAISFPWKSDNTDPQGQQQIYKTE